MEDKIMRKIISLCMVIALLLVPVVFAYGGGGGGSMVPFFIKQETDKMTKSGTPYDIFIGQIKQIFVWKPTNKIIGISKIDLFSAKNQQNKGIVLAKNYNTHRITNVYKHLQSKLMLNLIKLEFTLM